MKNFILTVLRIHGKNKIFHVSLEKSETPSNVPIERDTHNDSPFESEIYEEIPSIFMQNSLHLRSLQSQHHASANPYLAGRGVLAAAPAELNESGKPPRARATGSFKRSGTAAGTNNENFVNLYQPALKIKDDSVFFEKSVRGRKIDQRLLQEQRERMQQELEARHREAERKAAQESEAAEKRQRDAEVKEKRRSS